MVCIDHLFIYYYGWVFTEVLARAIRIVNYVTDVDILEVKYKL